MTFDEWADENGVDDPGTEFRESYRDAWDAGAKDMRERCAQICEDEIAALIRSGLQQHATGAQGCLNGIRGDEE